jgi:hypothetical protein
MGLAEKKALKEFQTTIYPDFEARIKALVGSATEIDIEWDAMAVDGQAHLYNDCLPKVFFEPLLSALENIVSDDLGKEALEQKLKKIKITNTNAFHNSRGFEFTEGTLTLDHRPTVNTAHQVDQDQRTDAITKKLETGL